MVNGRDTRAALSRRFTIDYPTIGDHQKSSDGTQKWLAGLKPGQVNHSLTLLSLSN
jgi:adenine C2-methylase RlmN of 23S rRNA A2503 and tRNA A37